MQQDNVRVAPDPAKAVACLTRAAGLGNDYARVILGEMLLEGSGVPVDWRTGAELIRNFSAALPLSRRSLATEDNHDVR